jgi:hypothetical protein
MVHYNVTLMNKRTFEGKKVVVEARSPEEAFKKATFTQKFPGLWATLTAKVEANTTFRSRFQHKGLRYNR